MSLDLLFQITPTTFVLIVLITLLSGVIKGAIGFAMPLIIVSGLSSLVDPKLAIAGIILPIVVSNGLQTFRHGAAPALTAAKEHWRYILIVCIMIFATAQLVPFIPTTYFYFVLGIPVVFLSTIQLLGVRLQIKPEQKRWAEGLIAFISGTLGGLAGTWGPTTVLYLLAIEIPQIQADHCSGCHLRSWLCDHSFCPYSIGHTKRPNHTVFAFACAICANWDVDRFPDPRPP